MSASTVLGTLAEAYWDWTLRENPVVATYLGDFRFNDRLMDISDDGRSRRREALKGFLAQADALDLRSLPESDRVTAEVLRVQIGFALEEERHKFWQWEVDQLQGPQADFPQLLNFHPHSDLAGLEARFRAFPAYIRQYLENLHGGLREGRTAVRAAVERVLGQLRELLARPVERSPFAVRPELVPAVRDAVYPAFQSMRGFLERDYLPAARREDVGLGSLPGGPEAYAFRIRLHTTTDLTAEQIHRIGLEELESIREEMRAIAGPDLKAFQASLKRDPKNFFSSREDLLDTARRQLARAESMLPAWFGRLPKNRCEVKAIEDYREKDSVSAYYYPPDEALTRKGIYYANTYRPETRPRFNLPALTLHEAVPGHHLQLALALEIADLPRFRRNAAFTAYVEGWGLYAERLGVEMGFYEDELSKFGMLTYQAWRAGRLVVDTGLHALGWSRPQAVAFLLEHVALSETEVLNEVDRYIIWPGQALAYMIGKREICALREETARRRGPAFDLRAFHDLVLRHGALPLNVLRKLVLGG